MKKIVRILLLFPVMVVVIVQFFPVFVIGLTSFKTPISLLAGDQGLSLSLDTLFLGNYTKVLVEDKFLDYVGSSTFIAVCSTLLSISLGSLAAYALAKFTFRGKHYLSFGIMCSRLIPPVALALPVSILLRQSQLNDTHLGLVLAHTTFNLPFAIWLLVPFFAGIPQEFEEAAAVDGLGVFQTFSRIVLPLTLPGLIVAAIFCFLMSWNDFLFSLILSGSDTKTAPLAINGYMTSDRIEWGAMTASSMLVLIPAFILCLKLQRHMVSGMQAGGVKG